MTASSLVNSLRARAETIRLATDGGPTITIRVQLAEAWDAVRVEAGTSASVAMVKARALAVLASSSASDQDYCVTVGGAAVLDEQVSLATAGVIDGSTLLIEHSRRRPVR